jgi:predicted extracellular nuclease
MALAEVENRTVLEDLVTEPALVPATYAICHYDSPDERGIDVALLYRPDKFHLQGSKAIPANTGNPTRDILTVWGMLDNEPIFTAIVHWPSRIGGVKFTEPQRIACAEQLRAIVDSVQHSNPATKIIIMGDMNDNPSNKSIAKTLRAKHKTKNLTHADLYTPFGNTKRGSSVYDNRWNHYDNIILSGNMLRGTGLRLCTTNKNAGQIFSHPDMLDKRGYPLPTYRGTEYIGGASDHLPIYIIISK